MNSRKEKEMGTFGKKLPAVSGLSVAALTFVLNLFAYTAREANSIGYFYLGYLLLLVLLTFLGLGFLFCLAARRKAYAKQMFWSLVFALKAFIAVHLLWYMLTTYLDLISA